MKKREEPTRPIELFFGAFLSLTYLVLGLCFAGLIYGLFGESLNNLFIKSEPVKRQNRTMIAKEDDWDRVENGIHIRTGLVYDEGFEIVRGTCTACHSAKLVTQNRATRAGWKEMIVWMQKTQGLWDLGKNEPVILDYLAKHYAPDEIFRRPGLNLEEVEWFILDLEEI